MARMSPEKIAARKRDRFLNTLVPIADRCIVVSSTHPWFIKVVVDGVTITGEVDYFNHLIERLGYRPVRVTSNMLNPQSKRFCIDINTPSYCDPGSEAYHSM